MSAVHCIGCLVVPSLLNSLLDLFLGWSKNVKLKKNCSITVKNGSFSKIPIAKVVLLIYYHRKIRKIAMIFSEVYSVYGRSMKPFFLIKILFHWDPYFKTDSANLLIIFSVRSSIQKYVTTVFPQIVSTETIRGRMGHSLHSTSDGKDYLVSKIQQTKIAVTKI